MSKATEEELYEPLRDWVCDLFSKSVLHSKKIEYVEVTARSAYFMSEDKSRPLFPDVSALDNEDRLIVFECKMGSPLVLEQLGEYLSGTDFLYAVVDEKQRHLKCLEKMLEAVGIGLITYRKTKKDQYQFTLKKQSKNLQGILSKSNANTLRTAYELRPKIAVFTFSTCLHPTKENALSKIEALKSGKDTTYGYGVKRSLPPGSIVLFKYRTEIIGQAVVKINRSATTNEMKEGKQKGYEPLYMFEPFKELVCVFPRPIKFVELQNLPSFAGRRLHSVARMYPYLCPEEYIEILSKVFVS